MTIRNLREGPVGYAAVSFLERGPRVVRAAYSSTACKRMRSHCKPAALAPVAGRAVFAVLFWYAAAVVGRLMTVVGRPRTTYEKSDKEAKVARTNVREG